MVYDFGLTEMLFLPLVALGSFVILHIWVYPHLPIVYNKNSKLFTFRNWLFKIGLISMAVPFSSQFIFFKFHFEFEYNSFLDIIIVTIIQHGDLFYLSSFGFFLLIQLSHILLAWKFNNLENLK